MKLSFALSALLISGFVAATTEQASAVLYCQYVAYPAGCVVRPGVVLRPRPVARAVVTPGVGAAGVERRIAHQHFSPRAFNRWLAWNKADRNRKLTPGRGMEKLKHGSSGH